jgi:hypothetical protein
MENERDPRERWLLAATIASGLGVALAHGGGAAGCASAQVPVQTPLRAGQEAMLSLVNVSNTSFDAESSAKINRGTRLEVEWTGATGRVVGERVLVGVDPTADNIILGVEGSTAVDEVPVASITRITTYGGSRVARGAGYGAIVGGLTGAAVGAIAVGSSDAGKSSCGAGLVFGGALVGGAVGGGAGTGVGAVGGAAAGPEKTDYVIGPNDWAIALPRRPQAPRTLDASTDEPIDGGP